MADPRNMPILYVGYRAEFGHSGSNDVAVSKEFPKIWEHCVPTTVVWVSLTPKHAPPKRITMLNLIAISHRPWQINLPEKFGPSRLPLMFTEVVKVTQINWGPNLPRWLSWLRHSAHRPERSVRGAGVQFLGSAGRFRVRISGVHALRLISRAGKRVRPCPL